MLQLSDKVVDEIFETVGEHDDTMWVSNLYFDMTLGHVELGDDECVIQHYEQVLEKDGKTEDSIFGLVVYRPISSDPSDLPPKEDRRLFNGNMLGSEVAKCMADGKMRNLILVYKEWGGNECVIKRIALPGKYCRDVLRIYCNASDEDIDKLGDCGQNIDLIDWVRFEQELESQGYLETIKVEAKPSIVRL